MLYHNRTIVGKVVEDDVLEAWTWYVEEAKIAIQMACTRNDCRMRRHRETRYISLCTRDNCSTGVQRNEAYAPRGNNNHIGSI
jgi:hypothetical protein